MEQESSKPGIRKLRYFLGFVVVYIIFVVHHDVGISDPIYRIYFDESVKF
jgi:hypothetical protein